MDLLSQWLNRINQWLAVVMVVALAIALLYFSIGCYSATAGRRSGWRQSIVCLAAVLGVFLLLVFWLLTWLGKPWSTLASILICLSLGIFPVVIYMLTRRYSGRRGLYTALWHVVILCVGWWLGRSLGLLLFSLPLLAVFYIYLYQAALVTVPASRPEDGLEQRQRACILLSYAWGMQSPMYVVADHAGRKVERRINGPIARGFGAPGLLWTRSHQVAGITNGIEFRRVAGPGVIFLGRLERPFQVVDLRNQLRVSTLDATSQDGICYKAILFMAFRLDREEWSEGLYDQIRKVNPMLERARHPVHRDVIYPYSPLRVQAVLSKTGIKAREGEHITLYWDEWVVSQVEEVARQELYRYSINGFWQATGGVTHALDEISRAITDRAGLPLRAVGVQLLTARIVNFRFSDKTEKEMDHISQQQIETWKAAWERKREELLGRAEAEANRMQQEAWAYAQSLLLTSIAEGFEQVKELHPQLPQSAIALLFLSAVQDYITRYQPAEERNVANVPFAFSRLKQSSNEEASKEH